MTSPLRRRSRRGTSLLELMIAAAILVIGLVGVVGLFLRAIASNRDGTVQLEAALLANGGIDEYATTPYSALAVGADLDAGQFGDDGVVRYARSATITDVVAAGTTRARNVAVTVGWRDSFGRARRTIATTVISQRPDGG
jgi:Tfp pilus assembly protein PilV